MRVADSNCAGDGGRVGKIDPEKEQQRLTKVYAGMSDGELQKVGRDPAALTEWAYEALQEEFGRRNIEWQPKAASKIRMPTQDDVLGLLCTYSDALIAAQDRSLLTASGAEARFLDGEAASPEGRSAWSPSDGVQLLVRASDLERGLELLRRNDELEAHPAESNNAKRETSKPVVLRLYRDITAAMVDRTTLESAGIDCFLFDDNPVRLDWFISNAIGGVKLVVPEEDVEEAGKILTQALPDDFSRAEKAQG